ncbi:MAG: hypothetical protein EOP04_05190 [Proteobacteria bacterium]|nr:MAG: hypothetical protein EOP04_05190 [Pseudomonadota bacterium]
MEIFARVRTNQGSFRFFNSLPKAKSIGILESIVFAINSESDQELSAKALKLKTVHIALLKRKIADEAGLSKFNSHLENFLKRLQDRFFEKRGYKDFSDADLETFMSEFFLAVELTTESGGQGQKIHVIAAFILRMLGILPDLESELYTRIPERCPHSRKLKLTVGAK